MKTIIKIFVAAIVAMALTCVLIMHDASDNVVLTFYFCSAIGLCAILGVFDIKERKNRILRSGSWFNVQGSRLNKAA